MTRTPRPPRTVFTLGTAVAALALAGGALLVAPGAASEDAPRAERRADRMLERWDADGDGRIGRADLDDVRLERFRRLDGDGDGRVSLGEIEAHVAAHGARGEAHAARMFERMDRDGDGALSAEERARRGTMGDGAGHGMRRGEGRGMMGGDAAGRGTMGEAGGLGRMDADGDGRVTRAELDAARAARLEAMAARLAAADADGDGALTEAEFAASGAGERGLARLIERFDADGDGSVSREELLATARR